MSLSIVVAVDQNFGIGYRGGLPWHLPADLKRFKEITMGHWVIMGRRTHESILDRLGLPLPGRHSVVVTHQENYRAPGCLVANSFEAAIELSSTLSPAERFVIGGAKIFEIALPVVQRIYLTKIEKVFPADRYFPDISRYRWRILDKDWYRQKDTGLSYYFTTLEKVDG